MKKILKRANIICVFLLSFTISYGQTPKNKPDIKYNIHKEYDDRGNIIQYDSSYSYSYGFDLGDSLPGQIDSMFLNNNPFFRHFFDETNRPFDPNDFFDPGIDPNPFAIPFGQLPPDIIGKSIIDPNWNFDEILKELRSLGFYYPGDSIFPHFSFPPDSSDLNVFPHGNSFPGLQKESEEKPTEL